MPDEKVYIGTKLIRASEMDEKTFCQTVKTQSFPEGKPNTDGYKVTYPDGYVSWSPKAVFEAAYREISDSEIKLVK